MYKLYSLNIHKDPVTSGLFDTWTVLLSSTNTPCSACQSWTIPSSMSVKAHIAFFPFLKELHFHTAEPSDWKPRMRGTRRNGE